MASLTRRGIIGVLAGLIAAPTIIRVAGVMPVKSSLTLVGASGLRVGDVVRIRLPDDWVDRSLPEREFEVTSVSQGNTFLAVTREAVRLFQHENLFMHHIYDQWPVPTERAAVAPSPAIPQLTPVQVAGLGAAAALVENPALSRRRMLTFGGVREEGSVAAPGSSSSDNRAALPHLNQETVA